MIRQFILITLFTISLYSQQNDSFFVGFWNLENLFDTVDQPDIDDAEFLPTSEKQWDHTKFKKKLINIASVIMSMNRGKGPDILGMCEVENKAVVESLIVYLAPNYRIVHFESPDGRGIDNALIFREGLFNLISVYPDTVNLDSGEKTRSILWTRFLLKNNDTISFLVNHWPSRRGGEESESKRFKAALTLKNRLKSIKSDYIIAVGDFNDEPENKSIDSVLNAGPVESKSDYVNLAYELSLIGEGSYKYRDTWNMLDQIITNDIDSSVKYIDDSFEVFKPYFIVTQTGNYAGTSIPTFGGKKYLGGYSDHFPVTAKFSFNK